MDLYNKLVIIYPQLTIKDFGRNGFIQIQNDSDGKGDYIASWVHELPQPTQEQLK